MKKKWKWSALSIIPIAITAASCSFKSSGAVKGVYINEVCTLNKSIIADGYGEYSDWIEIYNSDTGEMKLEGLYLSDDESELKKWQFPKGAKIGAGEYLLVFASKNESSDSELHTNFGLSKSGDTLIFSDSDGKIIQRIDIPVLGEDKSYGRLADGTMKIMAPTPAAENEEQIAAPSFSVDSGFYSKGFDLELSVKNGAEIYYTTDGSNPLTSETAKVYAGKIAVSDCSDNADIYSKYAEDNTALSISVHTGYKAPVETVDKCMVVRAAAKDSKGRCSDVVQRSYFVTDGELKDYEDVTVISLVGNPEDFFDAEKGIYVVGNKWDWSENDVWAEDTDPDTMRNFHGRGTEWERNVDVTVFENGQTVTAQNMGVRIKGSSTRNNPQKSFNLYARSDYGIAKVESALFSDNTDKDGKLIEKYDSFSLRASGMQRLRDGIAGELIKDRPVSTLDMKPCVLFLNGEYWGLYKMTERLSAEYIESHYGISEKDVAMVKDGQAEEGDEAVCQEFLDKAGELSKLDMTVESNYAEACEFVDIESMIEHYAAGLYLCIFDWPNYNYAVWKNTAEADAENPYSDGKWRFVSFDFDHTMGFTYDIGWKDTDLYKYDMFAHLDKEKDESPTNLFAALLDNEDFRSRFEKVYKEYADDVMSADKADKVLDMYRDKYTDEAVDSELRWNEYGYTGTATEKALKAAEKLEETVFSDISEYFHNNKKYTLGYMENYLSVSHSSANTPVYDFSSLEKLSKYIMGSEELEKWQNYDLHRDKVIDSYDMIELRKILAEDIKTRPDMLESWKLETDSESGASAKSMNLTSGLYADISSSGKKSESVMMKNRGISIEGDKKYRFTFEGRATAGFTACVKVVGESGTMLMEEKAELTDVLSSYSFTFGGKKAENADIIIEISNGKNDKYTVTMKNSKLICVS